MAEQRFLLALQQFESALTRLHEVVAMSETDVVRDAMIQRFEFTFETAWKAAYRWLRARDADVSEEAFAVLPRAFANRLLTDEAIGTTCARNAISPHTPTTRLWLSRWRPSCAARRCAASTTC